MEILRVYLNPKEVLGDKVFVSGMEDVPATQNTPAYSQTAPHGNPPQETEDTHKGQVRNNSH